jgi:hypothetical protein
MGSAITAEIRAPEMSPLTVFDIDFLHIYFPVSLGCFFWNIRQVGVKVLENFTLTVQEEIISA